MATGKYGTEGYFTLSGKVTRETIVHFLQNLQGADDKEGAPIYSNRNRKADVCTATSTGSTNTSDLALVDAGNKISGIKGCTGTSQKQRLSTNLATGTYSIMAPKDGEK